jgi:serine/threonine protein kinase HipA of HipAB toxin-antitoxin module
LHAVHEAFVGGPRQHWAATAQALVRQRRLPGEAAAQVEALLRFGRLIGNSDMHFGNLSLWVEPADVAAGRFTLAPIYDMLPMRWRPDVHTGALDLQPFTPEPADLQSPARPVARAFWGEVAAHPGISPAFRGLAREMVSRLGNGT